MDMTDPTPYTDDDVERLAEWVHFPGLTNVADDREMARKLLAAGVTLPPEPDTPPEPQERFFYTKYGSNHFWVVDRSSETDLMIRTGHNEAAELVASLLNLDAKYEDQGGVGKAIEQAEVRSRMRYAAMSRMEAERDEARAEVERLTDELAKRPTEPLFTALMVDHDGTNVALAAEDSTSTYPRKGAQLAVYDRWDNRPLGAAPTDRPVTAEPLFIGKVVPLNGHRVIAVPDTQEHPDFGEQVAVFPLGHGPTDRPVTAKLVYSAIEAAGVQDGLGGVDRPVYNRPCDWTLGEAAAVADALNVQLGRTPAPQPTRAALCEVIERATGDSLDDDSVAAIVAAVDALYAEPVEG